jgi:predicted nuclease of predicted toxin-antitoxin system
MNFLLDENIEHEVCHRLRNDGHDVRHVDLSDRLSKGNADAELATFSLEHEFVIVTYDDDFRDDFSEDEYHAVLYLPDQTLSSKTIADVLHEISTYYTQAELRGFLTIGQSWL